MSNTEDHFLLRATADGRMNDLSLMLRSIVRITALVNYANSCARHYKLVPRDNARRRISRLSMKNEGHTQYTVKILVNRSRQ